MNGHFSLRLLRAAPQATIPHQPQARLRKRLRIIPGHWESRLSHHRSAIEHLVRHDPCLHHLLPVGEGAGSLDSAV